MEKIVLLDAGTLGNDILLQDLKKFGEVVTYQTTFKHEVAERIKDQTIVIGNKAALDENSLKNAKNLKLICITATGTDNVDLAYAKQHKIAVTNVAGYSTMSVAQHTFALLFYLYENLSYFDQYVKSGQYTQSEHFTHHGRYFRELDKKVWGIIGLGSIGKKVAEMASVFGCRVLYCSPSGKPQDVPYDFVDLETLLEQSDIVSIHAPLRPDTKNLIQYAELSKMKADAVLLNLGRGGIINEVDLVQAIDEGKLFGVGLDVLEQEPMQKNAPLLHVKYPEKLLITPHIAWASREARERLVSEVVLNIEAFLAGKTRNRVC